MADEKGNVPPAIAVNDAWLALSPEASEQVTVAAPELAAALTAHAESIAAMEADRATDEPGTAGDAGAGASAEPAA